MLSRLLELALADNINLCIFFCKASMNFTWFYSFALIKSVSHIYYTIYILHHEQRKRLHRACKGHTLEPFHIQVSFYAVSLFTNLPVDEITKIIREKHRLKENIMHFTIYCLKIRFSFTSAKVKLPMCLWKTLEPRLSKYHDANQNCQPN